jgi:tRNA-specific 2-thiouridylase
MRNWHDESVVINQECPWIDDSNDAMLVASQLGIPFQVLDLSKEYKERIVDYMFAAYAAGQTPNPDVLCNREIKFDLFLQAAEMLGADYIATGHYARKVTVNLGGEQTYHLYSGVDSTKDQSYFLCQLNQAQLSKALFPIGEIKKSEVRSIAARLGLATAEKKDSQGLCFIGKVKLPIFLQQQLLPKEGNVIIISPEMYEAALRHKKNQWQGTSLSAEIVEVEWESIQGKWIGKHQGAHYYTVGQRKGLLIGGFPEPLFVLHTDTKTNVVYVGMGEQHPGLYRRVIGIPTEQFHWISGNEPLAIPGEFHARIRYRQELAMVSVKREDGMYYFIFSDDQKAPAPGQFLALYKGEELLGSGVI